MKPRNFLALMIAWIVALSTGTLPVPARAQAIDINWQKPINISNSAPTSTDPFLLADPAGVAHLFWAEKTGPAPGNQADTIMYAAWNGRSWSQPIDLYVSPMSDGNPVATYPRAVIDERGVIHLIWMTLPNFPYFAVNYKRVPAWEASNLSSWSAPVQLAKNLTGQQYSADIAYSNAQGLHVAYASGIGGQGGRAVTYIHSSDYGDSWSNPVDLYNFTDPERGASNVRIIVEPPERVYVSWTEWDRSGNGQAVYFTYSADNGSSWIRPYPMAIRIGDEYERDYNNMVVIGPNQLVSIWEGGFRAYRGAMYSYDGGDSWTKPVDVFPYLIGDNGSVEFVIDGSGRLHAFIANRVREGYEYYGERLGLWHSVYLGDERWSPPNIATVHGDDTAMTNPTVTIINGNTIVAAWYGSMIYEIYTMVGTIEDAQVIPPTPWPIPTATPAVLPTTPESNGSPGGATPVVPTPIPQFSDNGPPTNPGNAVYFSIIPPIIIIISVVVLRNRRRSR